MSILRTWYLDQVHVIKLIIGLNLLSRVYFFMEAYNGNAWVLIRVWSPTIKWHYVKFELMGESNKSIHICMCKSMYLGKRASLHLFISKSHRRLSVSFSGTAAGLCIYHLFVCWNLNFFLISRWITLPTQSCLVLYSFYANLLHSLIMWLMVSSLSSHKLHLLFCCVLSILALIWLVLMTLFCVAIWRDSVSLLKLPFPSHVQVLWDVVY